MRGDVEFLDTITYTIGGVETVKGIGRWGHSFTRDKTKYTKWYNDNTLDKIFVKLAKSEKN